MLESVYHKIRLFKENHAGYDDHQFMSLLPKLLKDVQTDIFKLEEENLLISKRIRDWTAKSPEKFTPSLALAIDSVANNFDFKSHIMQMDTADLSRDLNFNASAPKTCESMGFIVKSKLQPAYKGIEDMKSALDSMSKIVPTVLAGQGPEVVENRTTYLLNIAYTKQIALKEASTLLMMQAA